MLRSVYHITPRQALAPIPQKIDLEAQAGQPLVYGYTVCGMTPTANNSPRGRDDAILDANARTLLPLTLASGAGVLYFIGWLLTL
jgi:hypothetical protein